MLDYVIQCIEYLGKESDVLAEINKKAAHEGSTLREQLSNINSHKAALEVVDAMDNLGITDEVLDTMAIDPFRDKLDSTRKLNCAVSEVQVPAGFTLDVDSAFDLQNIIESELADKGIDVSIKEFVMPNPTAVRISFESPNSDSAKIDSEIEKIIGEVGSTSMFKVNNSAEMNTDSTKQFKVYYEDENGNEAEEPIIIAVDKNLEGVDLYEAITDEFYDEMGPGYYWNTISSVDGDVELNSSVHDNPALKTLVEKIRPVCSQVSAVPTTENGIPGYKLIIRGAQADDIEPLAKEQGIEFASLKPLEDGFAVTITADALANSNVDPDAEFSEEGALRYRDYLITGTDKGGYVAVSPYGKFSPKVYKSIDEAKAAIDADMKVRFPEGEDLNSSIDTDKLKNGGDRVGNENKSHIDLDSGDGTKEAKLDKSSISKAMVKVLKEDQDTPLVYINLPNGAKAYIQPAGYEDNALVSKGKFDEAKIYVALYDKNYKPILVDGSMDKKMLGSEVVNHIKSTLGI